MAANSLIPDGIPAPTPEEIERLAPPSPETAPPVAETAKKTRKTRKTRQLTEQEEQLEQLAKTMTPEFWGNLWGSIFSLLATRLGSYWELNDEEKEAQGIATDSLVKAYGASIADKLPLIVFGAVTVIITAPRAVVAVKLAREKRKTGTPEAPPKTETAPGETP